MTVSKTETSSGFPSIFKKEPVQPGDYLKRELDWYTTYEYVDTLYEAKKEEYEKYKTVTAKQSDEAKQVKKELDFLDTELKRVEQRMVAEARRGKAARHPFKDQPIPMMIYNFFMNPVVLSLLLGGAVAAPLLFGGAFFLALGLGISVALVGLLLSDFYEGWRKPKESFLGRIASLVFVVAALIIAVGTGFSLTTFIPMIFLPILKQLYSATLGKGDYLAKPKNDKEAAQMQQTSRIKMAATMLFGALVTMGVGYFLFAPGVVPGFLSGVPAISFFFTTRLFVSFPSLFSLFGQGTAFLGGIPNAFLAGLIGAGPIGWGIMGFALLVTIILVAVKVNAVLAERRDIAEAREEAAYYKGQAEALKSEASPAPGVTPKPNPPTPSDEKVAHDKRTTPDPQPEDGDADDSHPPATNPDADPDDDSRPPATNPDADPDDDSRPPATNPDADRSDENDSGTPASSTYGTALGGPAAASSSPVSTATLKPATPVGQKPPGFGKPGANSAHPQDLAPNVAL